MSTEDENEVYLSAAQVRGWQDEYSGLGNERADVGTQIQALNKRAGEINARQSELLNKIRAAAAFSPKIAEWVQEQDFNAQPDNTTLTKAILKALLRIPGQPVVPRQNIQATLPHVGYPQQRIATNPNYFYTALKRLVGRGHLFEPQPGFYQLTQEGRLEAQKP
jgi:hypothetical protein